MEDRELWEGYLLNKAWAAYIREWDFMIYKEACKSNSNTQNISEFHACEFYDRSVMEGLLSQEEIKRWEVLTGGDDI